MNSSNECSIIPWSKQDNKTARLLLYICIIATIIHCLFWIQLIAYPKVRQWSMQWLYSYLATDLLLLVRFFCSYAYRSWPWCIPPLFSVFMCYSEAIFDNYLNLLQSYILLALNICRYSQIAHNHNVYSMNRRTILITHCLIYFFPLLGHLLTIHFGWMILIDPPVIECHLKGVSMPARLIFLLFSYFLPVSFALFFLALCLNYIRNTDGIQSPAIVDARQRYHRQLVIQSVVFYSLWILLWSPHLLLFPFDYKKNFIGIIAQILNYISITLDPIIIAALDVRFLQAWKSTGEHLRESFRRHRLIRIPVIYSANSPDPISEEIH